LKRKYGDKVNLLYTDTDSLIIEMLCDNFYDDIKENLTLFDTSSYEANNIHGIPKTTSVIGKMKDEYKGHVISEFYGTGAKVCCIDVVCIMYYVLNITSSVVI
jgi:hypothetical protein